MVAVLYPGGDAADDLEVLGCAENAVGLRYFSEDGGHELVSITEREGVGLLRHLRAADVLITTPFWPVYGDKEMLGECDVIVVAAPLTPQRRGLFDRDALFGTKRGALVEALEEGHLAGYAGGVWDPEPVPTDHPWRTVPNHAMTAHVSGTTLEIQRRYAAGVRESLENFIEGRPTRDDFVMVADGEIQSGSYKAIYG